jgi:hypothetical protein
MKWPRGGADLEKGLYPLVEPFFQEVVGSLPSDALRPLQALGHRKMPQPTEVHHLGSLVKQGFLTEDSGRFGWAPAFGLFLHRSGGKALDKLF